MSVCQKSLRPKITHVHEHEFIQGHFIGVDENSTLMGWVNSFFTQFYASVTKADYLTLRLGFIKTHCNGNTKFNFHKYMIRALEDDFKAVVGMRHALITDLWAQLVSLAVFRGLLAAEWWHTYFWIAFIPFFFLLAVGTKLEHVICELAHEVAEKHVAIEGELLNSFEIAYFFWIWVQYGFGSCIIGQIRYIVPRLIIGVFIQVLCNYSTLPLSAIVTQMGSSFKKAIFDEHVQAGLLGWAQKAKKRKGLKFAVRSIVLWHYRL
ncbi:hypothetical protein Droror1_Dr00025376 [Drosera rotundifolia]